MKDFVIEMIVNVTMLIRLDENLNEISFMNVNVTCVFFMKNVNMFYLRKMLVIYFGSKY